MKKELFIIILGVFTLVGFYSCSNDSITNDLLENNLINENNVKLSLAAGQFPTLSDIQNNGTVRNAMSALWTKTKNAANSRGRQEFGFYIYYNKNSGLYSIGTTISGPFVSGCVGTQGSIVPGRAADNLTVCAFFHTHTPLTYCGSSSTRIVGPSTADRSWASSNNLPCLLYDYSSSIKGGHNINASAKVYTFGPDRRPN